MVRFVQNKGWSAMHSETLDPRSQKNGDFKEAFNFGEFVGGKAQQPLPKELVTQEPEISNFAGKCRDLCKQLLELFALGLKIDSHEGGQAWFARHHEATRGASGSILRFLHYPASASHEVGAYDPDDVRAGAHSDYGKLLRSSCLVLANGKND
ncbi:MAG: hypothetical protein Q9183_000388 [Haloplaca sp. 2 TL-2023]